MIDEDAYRRRLEQAAKEENRRMRKVSGSTGVWPDQMSAKSRGAMGGTPRRRKVFFDPQDTHNADGSLK